MPTDQPTFLRRADCWPRKPEFGGGIHAHPPTGRG
jgi:hypothetical protein